MQNQTINTEEVLAILNKANFNYQYSGYTPNSKTMQEYIDLVEGNVKIENVETEIKMWKTEIFEAYEENGNGQDFDLYVAHFIADSVAQKISSCKYDGVTFTI